MIFFTALQQFVKSLSRTCWQCRWP